MPPPDPVQQLYASRPVPDQLRRRHLTLAEVPQNAEGLRTLAACGNWTAVQSLAAQLEQSQIRAGQRNVEAYLQYALVNLTALVKTAQYSLAAELLERLGDLDSPHYKGPTGESLVPFSLRFLHAVVPQFTGRLDIAHLRLAKLSETVYAMRSTANEANAATALVHHRWRRVNRALAVVSFERGDHSAGMQYLETLVDTATDTIEHILFLQQLGCAALRSGDLNSAQEAFKRVNATLADEHDEDLLSPETEEALEIATAMNGAFVDIFCGRANDALKKLHEVAAPVLTSPPAAPSSGGGSAISIAIGGGALSEINATNASTYRCGSMPAILLLRILAVNTFIVCHQYATSSERCNIPNSIASFEGLVRRYPIESLRVQATVQNLRRLYEWQGDTTVNRRVFIESLIDTFVVSKEAAPHCIR